MAQSQPSYLNLTWRSRHVSHRELLSSLEMLLDLFDRDGEIEVAYHNSREQLVAEMVDATGTTPAMYRTSGKLMNRSLPKTREESVTAARKIAARTFYMVAEMLQRVVCRVSYKKRGFYYETGLKDQGLSEADLYNMLIDVALTLKVHPYRLGLKAERKSQVFVPNNCTLRLDQVNDIFRYIDDEQGAVESRRLAGGQEHTIPGMITSLALETDDVAIRAVVVTEHRNISELLFNMQGNETWNDLRGVVVVMTGGYADWAVREFLCLLCKAPEFSDVPFIWLSDGDSQGAAQYLQCRFGSRATAFAAPSMVCPRLLYGGMKQSIVDDFVAKYPERTLGARVKLNPELSEEERTSIRDNAAAEATAKMQHLASLRLVGKKKSAQKSCLKGIRNAGYLRNNRAPEVEAVVSALEQDGPCFPLSCVSRFDQHGILFVMRDAVLSARNEQPSEVAFVAHQDSLRADFVAAAGGRARGSESQPQMASQGANEEDEEEDFDEEVVPQPYSLY